MQLAVAADREEVAVRAAAAMAAAARTGGGISLAGSNTPRPAYELVAAMPGIDWSHVHLWFGDERCVPPDDPESNYRMAHESLISRIDIPAANVHRMRGEDEPDAGRPHIPARSQGSRSTWRCSGSALTATRHRSSPRAQPWRCAIGQRSP